ncbi:hypothetical protein Daus18300_013334 [Diaporthe australafricana]|uniref:NmrA-like domain-containing protein n=1 Tax=Diaporthe australafricana TaxID=127596 RepID=A0ABR3VZB1_9PEZI
MTELQKIAVVGGAGNLGKFIVDALLRESFAVTAISRSDSATTFPPEVHVKKVYFKSQESLTAALAGQDALVCVIGTMATGEQLTLVDAAVAAKVKRFIPSEYGLNTRTIGASTKLGRILSTKIKTVDYLIAKTEQFDWFSWTGLGNNLFFDWSMKAGLLGIDLAAKKATIVDSGNEAFSTTNLALIGQAVTSILKKPEETANKYLVISSFTTTQNEILKVVEEQTGSKFEIKNITAAEAEKSADDNLSSGQAYNAFWDYVRQYQFADGAGHALKEDDSANALLGLQKGNLVESMKNVLTGM